MSEIQYSDGKSQESSVLEILKSESKLESWRYVGGKGFPHWCARYHLTPERSNLVRPFDFSGLDVLEIGAGMGGVSRRIAETAKSLTIVEGTQLRFDALSARLRDLSNWQGKVGNFQDVELERKFDVVCVIGVLEYSEVFIDQFGSHRSPFEFFLSKVKSALKDDGVLVLAIENQLGLKYWSGAPEDHTGNLFDGVSGYKTGKSPRTFSRKQLGELFEQSGFPHLDEYFPFPDYKLVRSVLSKDCLEKYPELSSELAAEAPFEDYSGPRLQLFSDSLVAQSLSEAGVLGDLSNSLLFVGSNHSDSKIRQSLLKRQLQEKEIAWYFSNNRVNPTTTSFVETGPSLESKKELMAEMPEKSLGDFQWKHPPQTPVIHSQKLRTLLIRQGYFNEWDRFHQTFRSYFDWLFEKFASEDLSLLRSEALDVTISNICVESDDKTFTCFDLEWEQKEGVSKTWMVFRNIVNLLPHINIFNHSSGAKNLKEIYLKICGDLSLTPNFEKDLESEIRFSKGACQVFMEDENKAVLEELFERPFSKDSFFRRPTDIATGVDAVKNLKTEIERLTAENGSVHQDLAQANRDITQLNAKVKDLERGFLFYPLRAIRTLTRRN